MRTVAHTAVMAKANRLAARPSRREGQALRRDALERWDWEGGVVAAAIGSARTEPVAPHCTLDFAGTEMAQLRMRVVALENLVLALLVHGSVDQRAAADAMARYIRPRPGFTAHPLTLRAAARMVQLVQRASMLQVAQQRH
jgi:hypothetical protein